MIGPQGGSGPGWYFKGKHYSGPQELHEAMNAEMDALRAEVDEVRLKMLTEISAKTAAKADLKVALLQNKDLQNALDRANAAMLKHQKHNGALEIAIQEAHRDTDAANRLYSELVELVKPYHFWEKTNARIDGHDGCEICAVMEPALKPKGEIHVHEWIGIHPEEAECQSCGEKRSYAEKRVDERQTCAECGHSREMHPVLKCSVLLINNQTCDCKCWATSR